MPNWVSGNSYYKYQRKKQVLELIISGCMFTTKLLKLLLIHIEFNALLDIFLLSIESAFSSAGMYSQDVNGVNIVSLFKPGKETKYLESVEICHTAVGHIHSMAVATNGQVIYIIVQKGAKGGE